MRNKKGFTLVEVIVVLVILAIMAAVMIPAMTGWINKAKEKTAQVELRNTALAAESAYAEVFAQYRLNGTEQVLYVKGQTSIEARDKAFAQNLKTILNDDTIYDNIVSVMMIEDVVYVRYAKDGKTYIYQAEQGKVTITVQ